ncbi:MAG: redoxin domain-containing protein [Anaerolineae bacterium]|nr:redoxin domain-containing protein [Anaerolineae bacterium]
MNTRVSQTPITASSYRYDHPKIYPDIMNDMFMRKSDLGPGDKVQPFDLHMTDGTHLKSSDLIGNGQPVLLVFGSETCPVTESGAEGLKQLYATYGKKIRFVMVTVREAHPGQTIRQPKTFEEKMRRAVSLKNRHNLPFDVAADDIDGEFHRTLGSRPNSAYVIDPSGTIIFRAQWANETEATGEALAAIVAGKQPPKPAVTNTLHSITQMIGYMNPVLDAAGKGARLDTWMVVPPMGMMMTLSELFFFLPRHKRGLPAMLLTMGLMTAAFAAVIILLAQRF